MKKRSFIQILLAALLTIPMLLSFVGCASSDADNANDSSNDSSSDANSDSSESGERVLKIASTSDFSGGLQYNKVVDGEDTYFIYFNTGVYESLVGLNNDYQPIPGLATEWSHTDDGLEWTFKLKEGVKFHNGTDFNADAVIANVNIFVEHPELDYYGTYKNLTSIEAVDEYTVKYVFSVPEPAFECKLFFAGGPIYAPEAIGEDGVITKPIGTGPLVFESYEKGSQFVFTANKDYHGGELNFDKVEMKFLPDANTRLAALQAGEVSCIIDTGGILPDQVATLEADPNMVVETQRTNTSHYLLFNYKEGPFTDVRMRQMLNYALDRETLVDTIVGGYGLVGSESSAWSKDWNTNLYKPTYDMAKAEKLASELDEYKDDNIKILICSNFAERYPYKEYAEYIKYALDELGFTTEIVMYEYGGMGDALNAFDFDIAISIHSNVSGDAGFFYDTLINSQDWLRQIWNTEEAAEAVQEAAIEMDLPTRQQMYKDLYQKVLDEVWYIPLYHETAPYAYNSTMVENLVMDANFCMNFTGFVVK
jgi:peptide/nickel transport system substrate-binding protein